jgi:hypothetical protein
MTRSLRFVRSVPSLQMSDEPAMERCAATGLRRSVRLAWQLCSSTGVRLHHQTVPASRTQIRRS